MKKFTSEEIIELALKYGATLAGIANVEDLKKAPAFTVVDKMPEYKGVGTYMRGEKEKFLLKVKWPDGIKSVIVLAYHHPIRDPQIDYWFEGHNTIGNRKLIGISKKLEIIMAEAEVKTYPFSYHIEEGGIFLKDSAVIAGIGCIGRNNLLVTPNYGSQLRLRAIGLSLDLPSTGSSDYDPCANCDIKCWEKCIKNAFAKKVYSEKKLGRTELTGRIGNFDRTICNIQMEEDEIDIEPTEIPIISAEGPVNAIKYCRICECVCPACK
jgi:epoxyqueuosine reductase